ncbi:hypothetical protein NDU88_000972 [Pleurodeles waltl]|uniref:Uncharacterized protein n=1 Tax=Pleurodeles waltl TaxID=8319 RepID=A0AAV7VY34_PLEWA|nr:hypothetical protein NDU88_000972 [Pleurodeles waltl]
MWTEVALERSARGRRGTLVESPRCGGDAGWGPGARLKTRPVGRRSSATPGRGRGPRGGLGQRETAKKTEQ